jgi:hypothetical protein
MPTDPAILSGARQIVQQCLGLEPTQQLVVFVDETTVEPGVAIATAAEELAVPAMLMLVPVAVQRRIPMKSDLSFLAQGAAREARAILTCVNAMPECLPFRQRILEAHWTARTRIGHMPGASTEVLRLADVDFDRLVNECWCLEIAMARGQTLELISYGAGGESHHLEADLGGWDRLPVASDGVICDGAWGNVPSGETFVAPVEGTAQGSVVINGSIPGLVIDPGTEMVLHFEWGRLVRIEPPDGPAARWLRETQIAKAQAAGDLNWANLAEIGVGLNPAVEELTGNMLFDEKAAGTAHIALGSNTFMGGTVKASIHCDMVTRGPTIRIDGKSVVDNGRLAYVEQDWHEHHAGVSLDGCPLQTARSVARSGVQASLAPGGRLQRVLRPETGRVSACFVGDQRTAHFAQTLFGCIPAEGSAVEIAELAGQANMDVVVVRQVLEVLRRYDLVEVW